MKQLSQKEFEKCPKWLKKPKTFHSKLETLRYETIPITFHYNFVGGKLYIILSVSVLSVSVSADMKIIISVFYRYRPIKKLSLSGFIGIGRYEKKLIGRTLCLRREDLHLLPFLFGIIYQCLKEAKSSRNCFIMAPSK